MAAGRPSPCRILSVGSVLHGSRLLETSIGTCDNTMIEICVRSSSISVPTREQNVGNGTDDDLPPCGTRYNFWAKFNIIL